MVPIDAAPTPNGELVLQTFAMPANTNAHGAIFGGWLVSQMDLAGSIAAGREAKGRVATVAIDKMNFMVPVKVGAIVSCYSTIGAIGRSSIEVNIEVWVSYTDNAEQIKVTEGDFVFVAIDQHGHTRQINKPTDS